MERVTQKKDRIKKIKAMRTEKLGKKLKVAQNSTASMGKFDKKVNREEVKHQLKKKKRILPGVGSAQDEVKRNKGKAFLTGRTAVFNWKVKKLVHQDEMGKSSFNNCFTESSRGIKG